MPVPRFEVPAGVIDGVNTVFTVSVPYRPGTTAVYRNGLLLEKSLTDGWFETLPAGGVITMKEPPESTGVDPDVLQVFFIDTSPVAPETEVTPMFGKLREAEGLGGLLIDLDFIPGRLVGRIVEVSP